MTPLRDSRPAAFDGLIAVFVATCLFAFLIGVAVGVIAS